MRIALLGKSGAGKSTVASALSRKLGLPTFKTGTICRQIATLALGSDSKDNTQKIDDALTTIDPSIFFKAVLRNNANWSDGCIIDSLRFDSDCHEALERDFILIRIISSDELRRKRLKRRGQNFTKLSEVHRSETELDGIGAHFEITNSGSKKNLIEQAEKIAHTLNAD